ncbi:MAG: hypothetical protein HKN39_04475 [Flavobacteriales bacterium]|nr:hypothetical protein [Flavobacteriales bacterium]
MAPAKKIWRVLYTIILPIAFVSVFFIYSKNNTSLSIKAEDPKEEFVIEKQRGAHVFGLHDSTDFQEFKGQNIEWITMVPWGFQKNELSSEVSHGSVDSLRATRHDHEWAKRIKMVRSKGFKVFLKPHLWIHEPSLGKWRSDIFPSSEEDWKMWSDSYSDYIVRYAKVAEEGSAEMYCIGTEFSRLTLEKPEYWIELIANVRKVYSGKVVYAANWYKEYEEIGFWDQLDFIGIQAYFPLSKSEYPGVEELSQSWNEFVPALSTVSEKYDRKILFTEMGYRSTSTGAIEPWLWVEDPALGEEIYSGVTQANCYQAFFNSIWDQEWFAGLHLWQMRPDIEQRRNKELDFTPQGKPASDVIRKGYE